MILRERCSNWSLKDFGDDSLDSVRRMCECSHHLGVSGSISLFPLSWGTVIGIHIGKVGAHIGKDHHLGPSRVKMCAADSGESLKTEVGGPCGKQITWVELVDRPKLGLWHCKDFKWKVSLSQHVIALNWCNVLSKHFICLKTYFILTTTPKGGYCFSLYFSDEEIQTRSN